MSAPALPIQRPPAGAARATAAPAPVPGLTRLVAFAPLALFGLVHWVALVSPTARGASWGSVLAAAGAGLVLLGLSTVTRPRLRVAAQAAAVIAAVMIAFRLAGAPGRLLLPQNWDELAAGIGQGLSALPGVTVPYRRVDEWIRIVILLGGTLLAVLAALLAFWPAAPAGGRPGRARSPIPAAIALTVLYAVPVVERPPQLPFLGGAVFCLLLAAFLWAERLHSDQAGAAAIALVGATTVAMLVAPRLDGSRPWLDYESLATGLERTSASTFSWDHTYSAITWPRDGCEVLRVRARTASYWKATTLDRFDGVRWREGGPGTTGGPDTEFSRAHPQWFQTIRVAVLAMRTPQFIGAGTTLAILPPAPDAVHDHPGTFVVASGEDLKTGASYEARVYSPRPSELEMRAAGTGYPELTRAYVRVELSQAAVDRPLVDPGRVLQRPDGFVALRFPLWGRTGRIRTQYPSGFEDAGGGRLIRHSVYARMYALVQRLKAASSSPYDFIRRVEQRLRRGAVYSETPPRHRFPLESFVFGDPIGYCQQFSGAMALMLRMGGVPARVASGFTPGTYQPELREYAVSDLDAHSWVEAYFPQLGWATFDPTPAAAPAHAQADDRQILRGSRAAGTTPGRPADVQGAAARGVAAGQGGGGLPWPAILLGLLLLTGTVAGSWVAARRARALAAAVDPDLLELHRALLRCGQLPAPATTLRRLEQTLGSSPAARDYLRAVAGARYAGRGDGPTARQRRALRRELAAGRGLRGSARALWALPPRLGGGR